MTSPEHTLEDEWYHEKAKNILHAHRVRKHVLSLRSRYQKIDILDSYEYGRMLFLDNMAQSTERDEFIYHEMMVHPCLFTHQPARTVCIIGGAEGATLREVLKHDPQRVVMVDIDEELVRICREHLPQWSQGAFEDPRVELRCVDGRKYLEESRELFDAVLVDLSDPMENAPSTFLFTREFYRTVSDRLSPGGCVAVQSESFNLIRVETHARVRNTLKTVFPFVRGYPCLTHSYHEIYSFTLASKIRDPAEVDVEDAFKEKALRLRYYCPQLHRGMFQLPAYVYEAYQQFDRPITDSDVIYYPGKR